MMTPRELANQARTNAETTYRQYANRYLQYGIAMYETDPDGARSLWLDGMHALDCAQAVERGKE